MMPSTKKKGKNVVEDVVAILPPFTSLGDDSENVGEMFLVTLLGSVTFGGEGSSTILGTLPTTIQGTISISIPVTVHTTTTFGSLPTTLGGMVFPPYSLPYSLATHFLSQNSLPSQYVT